MRARSAFQFRSAFTVVKHPKDDEMTTTVRDQLQSYVRMPALPIMPGETVAAQMRKSWERLGRPKWWRLKAAWYGEAGSFSAAAAQDIQNRFLAWREAEAKRSTSAAETERARQMTLDRALLERTRAEHVAALRKIEARLACLTNGDALDGD